MKILSADFIKSCDAPEQFPQDRLPEVAIVGRSNVGKSSLINSLLERRGLAKVSGTPGKTRLINFFRVSTTHPELRQLYVVDLPGYGYAKVARSLRAQWGPMIEGYLKGRGTLRGVVLIVDARRVEGQDRTTYSWLHEIGRAPVVVETKVDKLARTERRTSQEAIRQTLALPPTTELIPYSAVTNEGRDALWQVIKTMLVAKP